MKDRRLTNFRLPEGILARLDQYAEAEHRTRTSALEYILDKSLPKPVPPPQEQEDQAV